MTITEFPGAYQEWLEKSQDQLIKSDWNSISKSYPFIQCSPSDREFTKFNKKLKFCRFSLISGAGLYLRERHEPFKVNEFGGDPTFRVIPRNMFADDMESCHEYTSIKYVNQDINVLMPLERMRQLEKEEVIGELSEANYSIYDFAPDATMVKEQMSEALISELVKDEIDVAMFFPVCELGHQTMVLLQAAAESKGIASVIFATNAKMLEMARPSRAILSNFPDGAPVGEPNNSKMQNQCLESSFKLLKEEHTPGSIRMSDLNWNDPYV